MKFLTYIGLKGQSSLKQSLAEKILELKYPNNTKILAKQSIQQF